jgi:hypothetical protein
VKVAEGLGVTLSGLLTGVEKRVAEPKERGSGDSASGETTVAPLAGIIDLNHVYSRLEAPGAFGMAG